MVYPAASAEIKLRMLSGFGKCHTAKVLADQAAMIKPHKAACEFRAVDEAKEDERTSSLGFHRGRPCRHGAMIPIHHIDANR